MAFDNPTDRPASREPCIYWQGTACTATSVYPDEDISCYNDSNCNGFGTCRGCSKYNQGGLKFSVSDGDGGTGQTPMNLRMYNLRAQLRPCCNWEGDPGTFTKSGGTLSPQYRPQSATLSGSEELTKCILTVAAPWQEEFTEENPSAYGCNGAKAECPFYTGPKFTQVTDVKMDTGDRITAKQVMELRYYSDDWTQYGNPREIWESRFEQPDIWAWVVDPESIGSTPGTGRFDEFGNPMVQLVTIKSFGSKTPEFFVGAPKSVSAGSPVTGEPADFPTLIRELQLQAVPTFEILWPLTAPENPFIKRSFTKAEQVIFISAQINTSRPVYAVNLTEHPQGGTTDSDFIAGLFRTSPEAIVPPIKTGMPGQTFVTPLVYNGAVNAINHIRLFADVGNTDGSMLTRDVYVRHIFYHAHVAQTSFTDTYGHAMVDPWVNHFTNLRITADFLHLTGNTNVHEVLWNTISSNGKKTIYAREDIVSTSSNDQSEEGISWESLGCGNYIIVTFNNPYVNRVYPWAAWGDAPSTGAPLSVTVDRSGNNDLPDDAETSIEMELTFSSTKGTAIPANMAVFKPVDDDVAHQFDPDKDVVRVTYAYTTYKEGPIHPDDEPFLKFPSDIAKVIDYNLYDKFFADETMTIEGVYIKTSDGQRIASCDQVIGDCYTKAGFENERLSRMVFSAGGVGEEGVRNNVQMVNSCAEEFNAKYTGQTFPDGSPVIISTAANTLTNMHYDEGSQHYDVVFKDEDGRPIGRKQAGFLAQSSMVQTRDVEIRYKWLTELQHFAINDQMILTAHLYAKQHSNQSALIRSHWEYDPYCGDHRETTAGNIFYGAFELAIDEHGPLWYPYNNCLTPKYHVDNQNLAVPTTYEDEVEGFATGKRYDYWERMRHWDKYMPAVMSFIPQLGCFWSERTTTLDAFGNPQFIGYSKIRSGHPFGHFASDRESVRVSRHWEKRNLEFRAETFTQEDDGFTIELESDYADALYNEDGSLKDGSDMQTPVWVHINDGLSVVRPLSEDMEHPFTHLLMERCGDHNYGEGFSDTRLELKQVVEERDYTSNVDRSEDGSQVYLPDGTTLNTAEGFILEDQRTDIRWVFNEGTTGWAWMSDPPAPERGDTRITGLFISNPSSAFHKKNFEPATHVKEGTHEITYLPHQFDEDGGLERSASVSLDGGPELLISQKTGLVFILEDSGSPYDPSQHEGEDYTFKQFGKGPEGLGILADSRGLQRFEVDGEKFATYAGVNINLAFDINELPYSVKDLRELSRIDTSILDEFQGETSVDDISPISTDEIDFNGHYYVTSVTVDFLLDTNHDVPAVQVLGTVKESGMSEIFDADEEALLAGPSSYSSGLNQNTATSHTQSFSINQRLFGITVEFGARATKRAMQIQNIKINVRDHEERVEEVTLYEPRVQISAANNGTHRPSNLEFYFQRADPDFAKDYLSGQLSTADLGAGFGYSVTKIPGTTIKWNGRRVKDLIPHFDFSDFLTGRFPYDQIDKTEIAGYVEIPNPVGTIKTIITAVAASSKGWTMYADPHRDDPSYKLTPTETEPFPNVYPGAGGGTGRPMEDLQESLYTYAGELLGDKVTVYNGFWHPLEVSEFAECGVDLESFSWTLELRSAVAPMDRVYKIDAYGCHPSITNEFKDGFVHPIESWQARGVWHYSCDARYSWACFTTVMNKCNAFIFRDYGKPSYLDSNLVEKYTYTFAFPPRHYASWIAAGLLNYGETGGIFGSPLSGGFSAAGAATLAAQPPPPLGTPTGIYGQPGNGDVGQYQ